MNKKYKIIIVVLLFIVTISIVLGIKHIVNNKNDSSKKEDTLIISVHEGELGLADGVEWSYEIELNNKKVTKYCSSSGVIASEKLEKEMGLDKRITRELLEEEVIALNNILANKEQYKEEGYPKDPGYILYEDEDKFYISENDINASSLKSITEGY